MNYIFFTSDLFLWTFMFGMIVWVIILSNQVSALNKTLQNTLNRLSLWEKQQSRINPSITEEHNPSQEQEGPKPAPSVTVKPQEKEVFIPARPPEYTRKQTSVTNEKSNSIENVFLGNIFNKIGAIALIVGFIFFIKLVSPYIVITNTMKIILGFIAGLGLFFGGVHLHISEKLKNYSEVLIGTGFATLFISTFCAYYLKVFNTPAALISGVILLLLVFFVSHKMKSVSSLVIGLIGGYLTPYLSGAVSDVSFSYLIFLNLVSVIYALKNPKTKWINPVNLSITMFILFVGCLTCESSKIVYPVILWAIYIVYDLLRDKLCKVDNVTCVLNYIFLTLSTLTLFKTSEKAVGIMFGITALIYALLAFIGKRVQNPLYKRFEHYIFLNVWFSILFTLNDLYSIVTWSVIALMLSFAVKKDKLNAVKHYITVYYLSAVFGILLAKDGSSLMMFEQYTPIFNMRSLVFLIPILSMILSIVRLKTKETGICNWLRFDVILLTYFYLISEVVNALAIVNPSGSSFWAFPNFMIYTIIGFVYSILLYSMYKKTKSLIFNITSVFLGFVSTIMFIISCFMYPSNIVPILNLRVLTFISALHFCFYFAKATKLNFFKYLAVFLGFLLSGAEASLLDRTFDTGYITTFVWLIYSGLITFFGIIKSRKFLINSGIWILIFTILRVFVHDLANVEPLYKIIAFLSLGIVLMIISYIYVKKK